MTPPDPVELEVRMSISPQCWGLAPCGDRDSELLKEIGLEKRDLEERAYHNTYHWLCRHFNEEVGAFYGFYEPRKRTFAPPQTANLIAPFQLIAAYDRYGEERFLQCAGRCSDWLCENMMDDHPMSLVLGGVRDNIKPHQLWTKYTADYVTQNLGLYERTQDTRFFERAIRGGKFLLQSQNHEFAPKYDYDAEAWLNRGWQSFGRVAQAMMALYEVTEEEQWLDWAEAWAEEGLEIQYGDGCFYLVNNNYYSSDVAADELRSLVRVYWRSQRHKFLQAAVRFADWHIAHQLPNGAWCVSIDRWGVPVNEYVGPGDVPNIAIAMLLLHKATSDIRYLVCVVKALRYSLTQQALPGETADFADDPNTHWGFWSWDPRYDYTMSTDQSTHHVRGYWFFLDYFFSLDSKVQQELAGAVKRDDANRPRPSS